MGLRAITLFASVFALFAFSGATNACVKSVYCGPRDSAEKCIQNRFERNRTVVFARIKSVYTDHLLMWRGPVFGGLSQLSYAELEVIETFKGKPVNRIFQIA